MCSFKSKEMNGTVASLAKSMQNLYSLILLLDVGWGQITTHLTSHTNLIDANIHIHTYVCKYVYTCMYHPNMSEQTNAHFFNCFFYAFPIIFGMCNYHTCLLN